MMTPRLAGLLRSFGPAIAAPTPSEALRAALGAGAGLALAVLLLAAGNSIATGLFLIAPFGASAVLLFAVPNSPLAQPWSAVMGNTVSALVAVAVMRVVPFPQVQIILAVGLAILAMALARAIHPPGGAVAMTAVLNPTWIHDLGFGFALMPVAIGTLFLVALAMAFARATGRHYPLRQPEMPNAHGTADAAPAQRLGLTSDELATILREMRQSTNVGVEDLARLIAAAEIRAAGHHLSGLTCADIMSRDLVTVRPDAPLSAVADLFRRHNFTSLPVVEPDGRFLGVIFQIHLIRRGGEDAARLHRGFAAAMGRMLDRKRSGPTAAEIMAVAVPRLPPDAPLGTLLPLLADGRCDAVPVLDRGRIAGIVTQTDLIAALVRAGVASAV